MPDDGSQWNRMRFLYENKQMNNKAYWKLMRKKGVENDRQALIRVVFYFSYLPYNIVQAMKLEEIKISFGTI